MLLRAAVFAFLTLALSFPVAAQEEPATSADGPESRQFTFLVGLGNETGLLGVQGEKYFGQGRFSVFGGSGYAPEVDDYPGGITLGVGFRGYTAGTKHRAFLELSVSQVAAVKPAAHPPDGQKLYGPGLEVGYQYTADGGFTLMASFGAGYGIGEELIEPLKETNSIYAMAGLGLGYTWK
jgi:hypothetical protein